MGMLKKKKEERNPTPPKKHHKGHTSPTIDTLHCVSFSKQPQKCILSVLLRTDLTRKI